MDEERSQGAPAQATRVKGVEKPQGPKWWAFLTGNRATPAMGRLFLLAAFGLAIYFWLGRPVADFPPTLEKVIMFLLIYNLYGKTLGAVKAWLGGNGNA